MAERMPKLLYIEDSDRSVIRLGFDSDLSTSHVQELRDLVELKFRGQLRRDPKAPQTAPPQPFDVPPIPENVWYSARNDNFWSNRGKMLPARELDHEFYHKWIDRKDEFPKW